MDDAARPFPKLETTPPVTKMYLVMIALPEIADCRLAIADFKNLL
jgi:hypothetical protein